MAELRKLDMSSKMALACLQGAIGRSCRCQRPVRQAVAGHLQEEPCILRGFNEAILEKAQHQLSDCWLPLTTSDAGTKLMDCAVLRQTPFGWHGKWSIDFKAGFKKQTSKGKKAWNVGDAEPRDKFPGRVRRSRWMSQEVCEPAQ